MPGEHSTPGRSRPAWTGKVGVPPSTSNGTASPTLTEPLLKPERFFDPGRGDFLALLQVGFLDVAVIGMEPIQHKIGQAIHQRREFLGRLPGSIPVRPIPTSRSSRTESGLAIPSKPLDRARAASG